MIPEIAPAQPSVVSACGEFGFPLVGPLWALSVPLNAKGLFRSPFLPLGETRIPKQGALAP